MLKEYEVCTEDVNSCGGITHAKREILEIEAESPEAYVKDHARFPIIDSFVNSKGDTIITTGDGRGNMVRYSFTE